MLALLLYTYEGEDYRRAIHITSLNEGVALYTNDKNETMDYLIENAYQLLKKIKEGTND